MTENLKAKIIQLRKAGYGYGKIAKTLDISLNTVKSFCRRKNICANVSTRSPLILSGEITCCENCGSEILQIAKRKKKRFCCDKCRNAWWNSHLDIVKRKAFYELRCQHCGKIFHIYGEKRRKYCSRNCYIAERFGKERDTNE